MSAHHPVRYLVEVRRHNVVVHLEEVWSATLAVALKTHFEAMPDREATIVVTRDHTVAEARA